MKKSDSPLIIKSIKLTDEHWQLASKMGKGNMTEGIRQALDRAADVEAQKDLSRFRERVVLEMIEKLNEDETDDR